MNENKKNYKKKKKKGSVVEDFWFVEIPVYLFSVLLLEHTMNQQFPIINIYDSLKNYSVSMIE